ncbi:MAG: SPOR domain-containing protein [Balneolaceae bacterium]|nr:SPOR domain-containing protein [Balneolaceae bacterium]
MKYLSVYIVIVITGVMLITACGPSEEEQQRQEQARQDSLEQVRQQQLEQQRQDSLANIRADSLEQTRKNPANVSFSENGRFAVQVESWRSQQKAQSRAEIWMERGFDNAAVVQYGNEETGNVWFRVRLGRLDSREAASQLLQTLQEKYQANAWIATL